eukprot:Awhi_evm1s4928
MAVYKLSDCFNPKVLFTKAALRSYTAEFIGMIFFLFVSVGVVQSQANVNHNRNTLLYTQADAANAAVLDMSSVLTIAFAFGMTIMVMAYSLGHISGGHFNPAVTMSFICAGLINPIQGLLYMICQVAGATIGVALVYACWPRNTAMMTKSGLNAYAPEVSTAGAFFAEFVGTALLCFVVFGTAVDRRASTYVKHMAPLAIGFAVFLAHILLVPLTGCGINPARSTASVIVAVASGDGSADQLWLYWIAPMVGGPIAALIHSFVFDFNEKTNPVDAEMGLEQRGDYAAEKEIFEHAHQHDQDAQSNENVTLHDSQPLGTPVVDKKATNA